MPKFIVNENFQFYGIIRREGATIEVTEEILTVELEKGTKEITDKKGNVTIKHFSGLLNHCSPADKETAALINADMKPPAPVEESPEARITEIKEAMDKIGKAYDNRWSLKRFENELQKARIETGL